MPHLLFVCHAPSPNTTALRESAANAIAAFADVTLRVRDSLDAESDDVRWADGILLGTTENFGAMAGRTKDFFERIYYPCLEHTEGLPAALYIRAGQDGAGTVQGVTRIVTGLRWQLIQPPLVLQGEFKRAFTGRAAELAATLAAGLEAGIF